MIREELALALRNWIHEQPFSQCDQGADTCPDWPLAYEMADVCLKALSEMDAERLFSELTLHIVSQPLDCT